jgi:hypothetical protein
MNSQTKQRYISTSIWSDDWFDSLSEREKLVYFYLLTNEHTNAAGVYECTLKNVRLEIGLSREEIEHIMAKFAEDGKAFYFRGYIIIPKWLKHQKISERSKMFFGAVKVLKSLPDEIKAFIADRRHYDYDVSGLIGTPSIPYQSPTPDQAEETGEGIDRLSPENDSLSIGYQNNGIAYTQNGGQKAHDLDLDSDLDLDLNINTHKDKFEDSPSPKRAATLSQHFIKRWQQNADVFNFLARLKRPNEWNAFWEKNTMTLEQIDRAIDNFIKGVKTGAIERRFIPSSPDGFVLNGWLQRSAEPFKKQQDRRISNDHVDDVSQYFKEI